MTSGKETDRLQKKKKEKLEKAQFQICPIKKKNTPYSV